MGELDSPIIFKECVILYPFIHIGNLEIPTYWLLNLAGVFVAYFVAKYINRKHEGYRLPDQDVLFIALFLVMGGVIGSRLLFILTYIPQMIEHPEIVFDVLFGGGSVFYGGAIGGILGAFFYMRLYGLDPIKFTNLVVVSVPLGHAIGRIGCFLAGCCYGAPTDSIFGVVFPEGPVHLHETEPLHPTQLYEMAYNLVIFGILLYIFFKQKKHKPYILVATYLILYGVARFINEFFRGDEYRGILWLSTSQWISIFMIILGVYLATSNVERFKFLRQNPPTSKSYRAFLEKKKQRESDQS